MNKKLLFIGLNGYAGAGKDTVAKIIKTILGHNWESLEECKEFYNKTYFNPTLSATFHSNKLDDNKKVLCIAYADQLKLICSSMFGIPFERFYMNKSNAWVCMNDKFQYTEVKPPSSYIVTAEEYYYGLDNYTHNSEQYWMSLREILVYVGTYVLQKNINHKIFVNIVRNKINELKLQNNELEFIIIPDNRFIHEIDYIHENHGITLTIFRDSIEQLDNIAEHELDNVENYDFIINNSGSYNDLFSELWNILHNEIEFSNITTNLYTRDNIDNYLRLINKDNNKRVWKLCAPFNIQKIYKDNELIKTIDPIGGPTIIINELLETPEEDLFVREIKYDEDKNIFYIITD